LTRVSDDTIHCGGFDMRRRLDPDERRQEILRAATRAFAKRPYDEVHIDAIAEEIGVTRTLVNHYFGGKRGLFVAVARRLVDRMPPMGRADFEGSVEEMVAANTSAWLDIVESIPPSFRFFLGGGPLGGDPELQELRDELRDRLARGMLANHLDTDEPPAAAVTAMRAELALIEQATKDWMSGRGGTREETQVLIVESILATVRQVLPAVLAVGTGADSA
jgi:AcrR family transcriptional regulator